LSDFQNLSLLKSKMESTVDLVQLRWQQIRSTECSIALKKENIDLKKQIVKLKASLRNAQSVEVGIKRELLDKLSMQVQCYTIKDRTELSKIKSAVQQEDKKMGQSLQLVFESMIRFNDLLTDRDQRLEQLRDAQGSNSTEIGALRRQLTLQQNRFDEEKEQHLAVQASLESDKVQLQSVVKAQEDRIAELQKRNEEADKYRHSLKKTMHVRIIFGPLVSIVHF
jgi:hypothetical protein